MRLQKIYWKYSRPLYCELIPSCFMGLPLEGDWKRETKKLGEFPGQLF